MILYLQTSKYIVVDTETYRRKESKIADDVYDTELLFLQVGDRYNQFVIEFPGEYNIGQLKKILQGSTLKIGHNIKYDYKVLKHCLGITLENVYDTMLVEQLRYLGHIQPKGFYTLEQTHERYTGINPYNNQLSLFDPFIPKKARTSLSVDYPSIFYAATDLITTDRVYQAQQHNEIIAGLSKAIKLENEFVLVLGDMELNGMPIDVDRWLDLEQWAAEQEKVALAVLQAEYPEIQNWNSHVQVGKLFKSLGIPVEVFDEDKEEYKISVQKIIIQEYAGDFPIIAKYLKYKAMGKLHSTYGAKFLKHLNPVTGRVHSTFMQLMNTGRISSTSPNAQNIVSGSDEFPEGTWWREAFKTGDDTTFIVADYSSQELYLLANISKEAKMLEVFKHRGDLHSTTAKLVYGEEAFKANPKLRKNGKIINFLMCYGGGASKLHKAFKIPKGQAQKIINDFFKAYPQLKEYFDITYKHTLDNGYIPLNKLGYKSFLTDLDIIKWYNKYDPKSKDLNKYLATVRRKSQNYPIQSGSAAMTKMALVLLRKKIKGIAKICLAVHDEVVIESLHENAEQAKQILEECMTKAATYFCPVIAPLADAIIVKNWVK